MKEENEGRPIGQVLKIDEARIVVSTRLGPP